MTEEVKKEEAQETAAAEMPAAAEQAPQQQVGINLLMTAVQESTTPQGKMAVFNQTVGALASATGVQIQQVGDGQQQEPEATPEK